MTQDKVLIRAKDIGLLALVLTVLGMLCGPLKKVYQWNDAVEKVAQLELQVNSQDKQIAVNQSQYEQIQKQLEQINWQLRRINR